MKFSSEPTKQLVGIFYPSGTTARYESDEAQEARDAANRAEELNWGD